MRFFYSILLVGFLTFAPLMREASARMAVDTPPPRQDPVATAEAIRAISGFWYTEKHEGIVELYPCDDSICGRFHWLEDDSPDNISRDSRNPDPTRQDRPLCGLQFMGGFALVENGRFGGGWIYSPEHGSVFSASMSQIDHDTLSLRGYILVPLLGETQTWQRAEAPPECHVPEAASTQTGLMAGVVTP